MTKSGGHNVRTTGAFALSLCMLSAPFVGSANANDQIETEISGQATVVGGVVDGDAAGDVDADVSLKAYTVLDNGIELGGVVEGRLDGQQPDQIFAGGRYTGILGGGPRGVAPLNGDAYLQSAYGYARGGFGEVIVGRDQGVARTLAVTAPTIFQSFNVNDWRTDFSGFNDIHTVNDFSGFATKISYLPPANFFGGVLGGLRLGVSYSPQLAECGDNLCAPQNRLILSPETLGLEAESNWTDAIEGAFYYQQEFRVSARDGLLFGLGGSYLAANQDTLTTGANAGDYEAVSIGLNLAYRGITIGGSVKSSDAGLAVAPDDSYLAFDAGVTYRTGEEAGDWGLMLGYGRAESEVQGPNLVGPLIFQDTQTAQAGVTYFVAPGITIGAGAQFVEAKRPTAVGGNEEATSVVIESSIKF
ncbi:MAG: hypothetical protein AAF668_15400 [Pseudomonadota bacterium]